MSLIFAALMALGDGIPAPSWGGQENRLAGGVEEYSRRAAGNELAHHLSVAFGSAENIAIGDAPPHKEFFPVFEGRDDIVVRYLPVIAAYFHLRANSGGPLPSCYQPSKFDGIGICSRLDNLYRGVTIDLKGGCRTRVLPARGNAPTSAVDHGGDIQSVVAHPSTLRELVRISRLFGSFGSGFCMVSSLPRIVGSEAGSGKGQEPEHHPANERAACPTGGALPGICRAPLGTKVGASVLLTLMAGWIVFLGVAALFQKPSRIAAGGVYVIAGAMCLAICMGLWW